jgi:putative ABC transport system permease protein
VIVRARDRTTSRDLRLAPILTLSDSLALQARFPSAHVSALRFVQDTVTFGARTVAATVAGVTPDWQSATHAGVAEGRWFAVGDAHAERAVLGRRLAASLFGATDPLGSDVLAAGEWRTVVGVLADAQRGPRSSLQRVSADEALFVPFETLDVSLGPGDDGEAAAEIVIRLSPRDDPTMVARHVSSLLGDRQHSEEPAFDLLVPRELLEARLRAERRSQALLLSIGLLALVISGVGILNIMVASVTERAPEIGVRRAVGANRRSVVVQFTGEAVALGVGGGALGVPVGALAAWVSAQLGGWPVAISGSAVAMALALALGVALGAGVYPARLAASISPIDALQP